MASTKYYAGVQYYFEPAGMLNIGAFVLDVKNLQEQLTLLPDPLRGLRVFGSLTRLIADVPQTGIVPKTVTGGIGYRYGAFPVKFPPKKQLVTKTKTTYLTADDNKSSR